MRKRICPIKFERILGFEEYSYLYTDVPGLRVFLIFGGIHETSLVSTCLRERLLPVLFRIIFVLNKTSLLWGGVLHVFCS